MLLPGPGAPSFLLPRAAAGRGGAAALPPPLPRVAPASASPLPHLPCLPGAGLLPSPLHPASLGPGVNFSLERRPDGQWSFPVRRTTHGSEGRSRCADWGASESARRPLLEVIVFGGENATAAEFLTAPLPHV